MPSQYESTGTESRGLTSILKCAPSDDGLERFACPTPDRMGRYRCIDDHMLCDGFIDCAAAEDEDRMSCMFYKTVLHPIHNPLLRPFINFPYFHS
ncbi:hypothetical protein CDAR_370381 [Caerostris darwini]|uniref:Uncharacterized protein n=1 Tax=Caerostris darwini TaxID=1538125 RepID=A0AAV4NL09_9ARAC|nr:hypothetical protein CDAR_370381 [Caerostris darwini]